MNYYSRNSPVKKKRNPPPGFLIPSHAPSSRSTSRSKLKSQFQLSSQQSPRHSEPEYNNSQEMLILDDDRIYVPDSGEILIQEDQQDPINQSSIQNKPKLEKSLKYQQEQQKFRSITIKEQRQNLQTHFKNIQTVQKQHEDIQSNNQIQKTQQDDKNILRNYSFGSKQFHEVNTNQKIDNNNALNQPLIRKIVNIQLVSSQSTTIKQIKKTQKDKLIYQQITTTNQPQQSWNKLVKNFIKKRESTKQDTKVKQEKVGNQHEQRQKQILMLNAKDQQQVESNETGYFGVAHEQKQRNHQHFGGERRQARKGSDKFQYIPSSRGEAAKIRKQSEQIHIQEEQQPQSPSKIEEEHWIGSLKQESQLSESVNFNNSTSLLQSTINQLPRKLVPTYLAIHEELVRRQHEAEITLRRMRETQEMIKMLIKLQRKSIYVDEILLTDFHSPNQQRMAVNQEIIFSLVRKLAALM